MHFKTLLAALATIPAAVSAISITAPGGASAYWVGNSSNTITWTYTNGDPAQVSILVTNQNASFFNGPFSIAEFVPVSTQTITVTNVTLNPGPGYIVNFVNPINPSQGYAQSQPFEVKPGGTPPATVVQASTAKPSGTGATGSGTATGTGTATGSSTASPASSSSAALANKLVSPVGASGAAAVALGLVGGVLTFMF